MLKDLTPREKAVLARICMRKIVSLLDDRDFGRYEIPGLAYSRPHLNVPASVLFDKYYAKLSPQGQAWYQANAECVIVAGKPDILDSELPYYQQKVEVLKKQNGGHVLNDKGKGTSTTTTAKQSSSPKSKDGSNR